MTTRIGRTTLSTKSSSPKKTPPVVMPSQGSSVRPSRIPVLTRSPRRIPSSTDENGSESSQDGTEEGPDPLPRDLKAMEYHEILSNPLDAHEEAARLDPVQTPAPIFEPNNPAHLQETPSKRSFSQQDSPTKQIQPKRSFLSLTREKNQPPNTIPPTKKSFLSATKDTLARAMRGASKPASNSAAVTAAINAVYERLGHPDMENKQDREIVECLFRTAECYNKANISAKQAETFARDAKRHAREAREEVVKICELLRHAGFDDETVRRLDNMIRTVAEVGLE